MPILDIFKKKKKLENKKIKPEVKTEKRKKPRVIEKPREEKIPEVKPVRKKRIGEAWKILESPHITEKATSLVSKNQYVFKVWPNSNKTEIKKAIENIYGVDVVDVKIINIPKKKRRLGRTAGFRKGYKKAIVKIKEGQKIEVLPR
jgi:large subunit ribosomal protein L23